MSEALAKPAVNPIRLTYLVGTQMPVSMDVVGIQVQVGGEIEDVTAGASAGRRLAKTGLVLGRILATGYMQDNSVFELLRVIDNDSGQGDVITIEYGVQGRKKEFTGYLESLEVNSIKTRAYVGVAVGFRLCGPQNDLTPTL